MTAICAQYIGPRLPLHLTEVPLPSKLDDGEVLVFIELAAICGSDLHTLSGTRSERIHTTMGHEGVGRVAQSARNTVRVGDRVTWSLVDICGTCPACDVYDLPQKCQNVRKYGHDGPGPSGTYGTHILLQKGTMIQSVPIKLHPQLAATANCALATACQLTADLPRPERALVLGAGLLGLYCAHLLESIGWEVEILEKSDARLRTALSAGFKLLSSTTDAVGLIVEAAGSSELLPWSYPLLRPGGELRLAGLVHPESQLGLSAEDIIRRCWTIRGYHNYHPIYLETALQTAPSFQARFPKPFELGPVFSLLEINQAIEAANSRSHLRVFVTPETKVGVPSVMLGTPKVLGALNSLESTP